MQQITNEIGTSGKSDELERSGKSSTWRPEPAWSGVPMATWCSTVPREIIEIKAMPNWRICRERSDAAG
jgi:hypothetical protein